MNRYRMEAQAEFGQDAWTNPVESRNGRWVKYEEVKAQLAQRDAALRAADELVNAVSHEREMPCQDFAMQSAAAMAVSNAINSYCKARR